MGPGLAYVGLPVAELGPRAIRPLVFIAVFSYCATFPLASRELGVIQGERRHGFYTSGQRSHRAIAWTIIAAGIFGVVLMFAAVIVIAIGLGHSDVP